MRKWEYLVVELPLGSAAAQTEFLNELGDIGWELITILQDSLKAILKRPAPGLPQA